MPALQDILAQLSGTRGTRGTGYGEEVPRYNAFEQAPLLAQAIVQFQKEQRANPYVQALQTYGQRYREAATDEARQAANTAANLARAAFINAGGSPLDLPRNLWGSSPDQGFQTGAEDFIPAYTGDFLSLGQREKQAALKHQDEMDELTKRKTLSDITGVDPTTGQDTWQKQYNIMSLNNAIAKSLLSSQGSEKMTATERKNNTLSQAYDAVDKAIDAGMSREEIEANIDSWAPDLIRNGISADDVKQYLGTKKTKDKLAKEAEDKKISSRPLWQKAIDAILPWAQYR